MKSLVYKSEVHRWDWNTPEACIQERDTQVAHPKYKDWQGNVRQRVKDNVRVNFRLGTRRTRHYVDPASNELLLIQQGQPGNELPQHQG